MTQVQRANFYYPKEISNHILSVILRETPISWQEAEEILDLLIPYYVSFGYNNISGFRKIMDKYGLSPDKITSFKEYDTLFPGITIEEMEEIGKKEFHLAEPNTIISADSDIKEIAPLIIGDIKKKRRQFVEIPFTKADKRAAAIAVRGKLIREKSGNLTISPLNSDSQQQTLYANVLLPSLFSAGIPISLDSSATKLNDKNDTINALPVSEKILSIAGDITSQQALYPHFGYSMPFPAFTRVVDENASLVRNHQGIPDVHRRGGIVMDRFFACYEIPTTWSMFYHALQRALDLLSIQKEPFHSCSELEQVWDPDLEGEYIFRKQFTELCKKFDICEEKTITPLLLQQIYSEVTYQYFVTSVVIGYPYAWLPKLRLEVAGRMDYYGNFSNLIPIHIRNDGLFTPGADLEIVSKTENTPYLQNIVGKSTELNHPVAVTPTVRKRVKNVVAPHDTNSYLYAMPLICPGDFTSMLENAQHYTQSRKDQQNLKFEDITTILNQLHSVLQAELQRALEQKDSVYSLFIKKTGLPLKEIKDQIELITKSFLQEGGKGIKRLAYSAFIDPFAPFELSDQELEKGLQELQHQKPLAPFFLVTPSNVNFYDAFYIFVQILLGKMTSQQEKNFTLYVRPSVSDLVFSFMIHTFHKITAQLDPENKKGLRSLIQKAYWDHTYDDTFLHDSIKAAEGGIYYGTAKVYREVVLDAILEKPDVKPLLDEETIKKIKAARDENNSLNTLQLQSQKIPEGIISTIQKHLSRHKVYNETLNAAVILPSSQIEPVELEKITTAIVSQITKLRGADCTSLQNVWIHRDMLPLFLELFKQKATQLRAGDLFDMNTNLAYYEEVLLKKAKTIMQQRGNSEIIPPKYNGERNEKHHTGVIITQTKASDLDQQHKMEVECLAHEISLPWLNLITYSSEQELIDSMETIQQKYVHDSGYPRYLYISVFNGGYKNPTKEAESFKQQVNARNMTDFFKEGEEAFRQFIFYRPHQGSFFLKDLVE